MAYSDKVVDHYENPRNVGTMDKSSEAVGTGLVGAPECGDVMRLQIRVNPQTQVIEDAKFKTFGCGSAIASSSLATEWVKGRTISDALTISNTDIVKELALPPVKIHCSVLAEDAIRAAIGDWKKKNGVADEAHVGVGSGERTGGRKDGNGSRQTTTPTGAMAPPAAAHANSARDCSGRRAGRSQGHPGNTARALKRIRVAMAKERSRPRQAACAWASPAAAARG